MENDTDNVTHTEETGVTPDAFSRFFEWVETFALYFAMGLILILLFFRHSPVVGTSMVPTLNNGDILIVSTFNYKPSAGDIVVCQSESYGLDRPLVKRIIATEGQTVSIDYENWTVTVDGTVLSEDYINKVFGEMNGSNYLPSAFTVPDGHVFVMGDNRNGSTDSRSASVGFIDERYILGKVSARLLPLSDFKIF